MLIKPITECSRVYVCKIEGFGVKLGCLFTGGAEQKAPYSKRTPYKGGFVKAVDKMVRHLLHAANQA